MSHIVNSCPQTKLEGELHSADDDAIEWLETYLAESYRKEIMLPYVACMACERLYSF